MPLTNDQLWASWLCRPEVPDGEDDSMETQIVGYARAIIAATLAAPEVPAALQESEEAAEPMAWHVEWVMPTDKANRASWVKLCANEKDALDFKARYPDLTITPLFAAAQAAPVAAEGRCRWCTHGCQRCMPATLMPSSPTASTSTAAPSGDVVELSSDEIDRLWEQAARTGVGHMSAALRAREFYRLAVLRLKEAE